MFVFLSLSYLAIFFFSLSLYFFCLFSVSISFLTLELYLLYYAKLISPYRIIKAILVGILGDLEYEIRAKIMRLTSIVFIFFHIRIFTIFSPPHILMSHELRLSSNNKLYKLLTTLGLPTSVSRSIHQSPSDYCS